MERLPPLIVETPTSQTDMAPSNPHSEGNGSLSQVLSRLENIECTLKEIQANTRSEDEKKYVFRDLSEKLLTVLKKKGTGTVVLSTGSPSLGCDFFLGCWAMIGMLFKAWFTLAREAETETEMEATVSVSVQVRTDMMEALLFVYSIIMTTFKTVEVTVLVRCSIISVGDIDTVKQEFTCDIYVSAKWREPRLKGRTIEDIDWDEEWFPRIVFFNALSIDKMQKGHKLFYEHGDDVPQACETYRITGTFRENLELYNFPLDYQELTVTLMSDWTDKMVTFDKDMKLRDNLRPETFTASQEWHLHRFVITKSESTHHSEGSSVNNYPMYHMKVFVRRKNGFYLWNVALIVCLITALSFTSFAVPISEPADRLSVTLTLLLTAVAFKFVVSQSLPTISYLTLLDKYVLSGLIFLFGVAVENGVVVAIPGDSLQKLFDSLCFYIAVGVFRLIHIVFIITVLVKKRAVEKTLIEKAKQYMMRGEEIDRLAGKGNGRRNKK